MMRIVYTTLFKELTGGGMGKLSYELPCVFAENHQVLFVHPGNSTTISKPQQNLDRLQIRAWGGNVCFLAQSLRSIRTIRDSLDSFAPDIVHLQDIGLISLLAQNWALKNHLPVVYTAHVLPTRLGDFGSGETSRLLGDFLDGGIVRRYSFDFFRNCTAILALNEPAQKVLRECGHEGGIFVVPNGVNLRLFDELPLADIRATEKRLLFVGDLSARKNQAYLLQVMRELPSPFVLDLVGGSLSSAYPARLKEYARKHDLRVNFIGQIAHADVLRFLQKAHVFISASKMEVQSIAILEALAAGRPVVGLSNETVDELVDEAVGYNLPKDTAPKQFAEKVEQICALTLEDYRELCLNARRRVEHLGWDQVVKETERVYSWAIEQTQAVTPRRRQSSTVRRNDVYLVAFLAANSIGAFVYCLSRLSNRFPRFGPGRHRPIGPEGQRDEIA